MDRLTLVSHHLCPYVQRAAIALAEKSVPFERIAIDLADKPAWFRALSPLGKVPLLKVERPGEEPVVIFESAVILEFLEETQPKPLHPADRYLRARHRAFIEFGSATLNAIARLYSAAAEEAFKAEAANLAAMFGRVEDELATNGDEGPWFAGREFSLVDAVFGPIFRYFDIFDSIAKTGVFAEKPRVVAWRTALGDRPSISSAVAPDYPERLMEFLRARDSHLGALARATSVLLPLARTA
jgi:glutathione S-transferase